FFRHGRILPEVEARRTEREPRWRCRLQGASTIPGAGGIRRRAIVLSRGRRVWHFSTDGAAVRRRAIATPRFLRILRLRCGHCSCSLRWPMEHMVVAHLLDGRLIKGSTYGVQPTHPICQIRSPDRTLAVPLSELKALFFVRDLAGNPSHEEA